MTRPTELHFDHSEYSIKWEKEPTGKGTWDICKVSVCQNNNKIGEYTYNYPSLHHTFWPFQQDDQWYALYSTDYTATSVMSLPDCQKIAGELAHPFGFCPVHLYVPPEVKGKFGFVAGCMWGDDTSWKIQFLDLHQIKGGIIIRDDRFGYLPMMGNDLPSCITVDVEFDSNDAYGFYIKSENEFFSWDRDENCNVYINGEPDEHTKALQEERRAALLLKKD